jgi:hypothetical protein
MQRAATPGVALPRVPRRREFAARALPHGGVPNAPLHPLTDLGQMALIRVDRSDNSAAWEQQQQIARERRDDGKGHL